MTVQRHRVVIVGGGHHGLVAAFYLARAGPQACDAVGPRVGQPPAGGGSSTASPGPSSVISPP
jgi:glycine/D-amino acid oxidase-like deaminating enzyme